MITFLEGTLTEKDPTRVAVNVQGVGYEVYIPLSSYDRLPAPGNVVRLLTYLHVREDTHALYGFLSEEERRMFLLLIGVSGIGPRLALTALSGLSVRDLKAAVAQADLKRLSSVSGIGKKTAERMIVELRDKITAGEALEAVTGVAQATSDVRLRDALLALLSLGYKQAEAQKRLREILPRIAPDDTIETIVRQALAHE